MKLFVARRRISYPGLCWRIQYPFRRYPRNQVPGSFWRTQYPLQPSHITNCKFPPCSCEFALPWPANYCFACKLIQESKDDSYLCELAGLAFFREPTYCLSLELVKPSSDHFHYEVSSLSLSQDSIFFTVNLFSFVSFFLRTHVAFFGKPSLQYFIFALLRKLSFYLLSTKPYTGNYLR